MTSYNYSLKYKGNEKEAWDNAQDIVCYITGLGFTKFVRKVKEGREIIVTFTIKAKTYVNSPTIELIYDHELITQEMMQLEILENEIWNIEFSFSLGDKW